MIEKLLCLQDFRLTRPFFYGTETNRLLRRYGICQSFETPSGIVTILPTCFVPLLYLDKNGWKTKVGMGNSRDVYSVDSLSNGVKPKIVVKSPERIFTKDKTLLERGDPWWGGSKSAQKRTIKIIGNPVVEEQAIWEAIILLELHKYRIRAELPQALIKNKNGAIELVVNEIEVGYGSIQTDEQSLTTDFIQRKTRLQPEDFPDFNIIEDKEGKKWIIDVNRWSWPGYTDNFRSRLLRVISEAEERC